jgi:N-acetylglucosamine-6-phosphate deacetylase
MTLVVRGGRAVLPDGIVEADIVIEGARIAAIDRPVDRRADRPAGGVSGRGDGTAGASVLDASGLTLAPGLIDLQCNGGFGIDLTAEPARVGEVAARLPAHGVTAWLPTVISSPRATTDAALATSLRTPGAVPLGWHLEGPMLNPARKGAHPARHLRAPEPSIYASWTRSAGVALVTLAPELPGSLDAIASLASSGVVASIGHTAGTADDVGAAVRAGATYVTHLWNAMPPFGHRDPGVVGAVLATPELVAGLIVDGVHLHPTTVAATWRALGPHRTSLVTDAVAALGMPPGAYRLGSLEVSVGPGGVRDATGVLAGSNLSAIDAVRHLMAFTGCTLADALAPMTSVPARLLGLPTKGVLAPGADADLIALTAEGRLAATIVGGVVLHGTPEAPWRS